jgi:hypothetical protein
MAKSKLLTLEQIDQTMQATLDRLHKERQIIKLAGDKAKILCETLKGLQAMRVSYVPLTLETALETYLESGENTPGYEWLQERTWKGEWKDSGLGMFGGSWNETNQRVLGVHLNGLKISKALKLNRSAVMDRLEGLIMEAVPAIKPGALGKDGVRLKTMSKGASADLLEVKVFASGDGHRRLGVDSKGIWLVFDENHYGFRRADLTGTLRECLDYMADTPADDSVDDDDGGI